MATSEPPSAPTQQWGLFVPPLPRLESHDPLPIRAVPWITDAAIDYLENFIRLKRSAGQAIAALECGCGSSTIYLCMRVARLVSFDHNKDWQNAIRGAIAAVGKNNIEWRCESSYADLLDDYGSGAFEGAVSRTQLKV